MCTKGFRDLWKDGISQLSRELHEWRSKSFLLKVDNAKNYAFLREEKYLNYSLTFKGDIIECLLQVNVEYLFLNCKFFIMKGLWFFLEASDAELSFSVCVFMIHTESKCWNIWWEIFNANKKQVSDYRWSRQRRLCMARLWRCIKRD